MGMFKDEATQKFAEDLAVELARRFPPRALASAAGGGKRESTLAKAMDHVAAAAQAHAKQNKVGMLKRLGASKSFQAKLDALGYDEEFIKASTLKLVQSLSGK